MVRTVSKEGYKGDISGGYTHQGKASVLRFMQGLLEVPKPLPYFQVFVVAALHSWHQNKINRRFTTREKRANSRHICNILIYGYF